MIPHPLCLLRGWWWSLRWGAPISGHNFKEAEHDEKKQVLHCTTCGHTSTGWFAR